MVAGICWAWVACLPDAKAATAPTRIATAPPVATLRIHRVSVNAGPEVGTCCGTHLVCGPAILRWFSRGPESSCRVLPGKPESNLTVHPEALADGGDEAHVIRADLPGCPRLHVGATPRAAANCRTATARSPKTLDTRHRVDAWGCATKTPQPERSSGRSGERAKTIPSPGLPFSGFRAGPCHLLNAAAYPAARVNTPTSHSEAGQSGDRQTASG